MSELEVATQNFSVEKLIGRGGYGAVFKVLDVLYFLFYFRDSFMTIPTSTATYTRA